MNCTICGKRIEPKQRYYRGPSGKRKHRECSSLAASPESAPPRFYWKQCYGMFDDEKHWALCDTQTDAEDGPPRVTCFELVLLANYPKCMDGKPLSEQRMPKLIAQLLTEHFAKKTASN